MENIPKKYGGGLDFECGKFPVLDQQVKDCLSITPGPDADKFLLTSPVRWIDAGEDGEMSAIGVGSIDGHPRKEHVATLHSLAVRVATNVSRRTQSYYGTTTETAGAPANRPPTHHNQVTAPTHPFNADMKSETLAPPPSHPAPTTDLSNLSLQEKPVPQSTTTGLEHPIQNGAPPPEKISMPPPYNQMERQETQYMTPASDPSELEKLG